MKDDLISKAALVNAIDSVDWYHQNKNGEMIHGANSDEHQAWYKAEDIYKAIESMPPAEAENIEEFKKNLSKAINDGIVATNTKDVYSCGMRNGMRWCRYLIDDEPPKFEKAREWIPTSIKPPEPFKLVLIQDSCGGYDLTMYIPPRINPQKYPHGYWGEVDGVEYDYLDVEAWCPLPGEYCPEGKEHE